MVNFHDGGNEQRHNFKLNQGLTPDDENTVHAPVFGSTFCVQKPSHSFSAKNLRKKLSSGITLHLVVKLRRLVEFLIKNTVSQRVEIDTLQGFDG